mgnify:CR=1 FL=1
MSNKETLEEAAERYVDCFEFGIAHPRRVAKNAFINGAKWQQEQDKNKFSEEMEMLWLKYRAYTSNEDAWSFKEWLVEQFKNK